ncbi:MAG: ABC transporter substrate-binding protein [Vallitaleaceae bacterium]|nr:ABC transporter substrate-binding protein [Vallitaleaceae bacterium]
MNRIKVFPKVFLLILICISVLLLHACSFKKEEEVFPTTTTEQSADLEYAELVMYLIGSPSSDYDSMLEKLNQKLKLDLNAKLIVKWIGWGDFSTRYPLLLASGETVDLIYTSTWLDYVGLAQKGAFLPLDEIGLQYAPLSFSKEPLEALEEAKVNGKIYALPPNYAAYASLGPLVRGDLRKSYGLEKIENLEEYGDYLKGVVEHNPELIPVGLYSTQTPIDGLFFYQQGLYPLSGDVATNSPFWIDLSEPSGEVINITEKEDLPDMLELFRQWYLSGYWPSSVLALKDSNQMRKGEAASMVHLVSSWTSMHFSQPEFEAEYTTFLKQSYRLPYLQDAMAVPVSAKHPERALMLLDLLRNDQSYYDLMTYGIEGINYEIDSEGKLHILGDGFIPDMNCSWGFRDESLQYDIADYPKDYVRMLEEIEASAIENIYTRFILDIEPIEKEYQAVMEVMQQYYVPLKLGMLDPVEGLIQLKAQLKAAGIGKVTREVQTQIDDFRKNHQNP